MINKDKIRSCVFCKDEEDLGGGASFREKVESAFLFNHIDFKMLLR